MPYSVTDPFAHVQYGGQGATVTGPYGSGTVWHNLRRDIHRPAVGFHWFSDFSDLPKHGSSGSAVTGDFGEFSVYLDAGGFIRKRTTAVENSGIEFGSDGDNEIATLSAGGGAKSLWASGAKEAWFECEFGTALGATATKNGIFVGLVGQAVVPATNVLIDDSDAMADVDLLGFHKLETSGNVDLVCKAAGQTAQTLIATVGAFTGTGIQTMKVGLRLRPLAPAAQRLQVYVNGVRSSTFVTKTVMDAATFPSTVNLGFAASCNQAATGSNYGILNWARLAQMAITR